MEALEQSWTAPPPFFISSALTKEGRNEILNYINIDMNNVENRVITYGHFIFYKLYCTLITNS